MILEYGQHKGKDISEVPEPYLEWLLEQSHKQVTAITAELKRREGEKLPDLSRIDRMSEDEVREALKTAARQLKREGLG
jgi:hypothetical protein